MSNDRNVDSITDELSALLLNPKYSDLEIRCDGRVFKVHRAIVCSMSKILNKECDGGFKESDTRVIEHTTFSASTVEMMLQFMYKRCYTPTVGNVAASAVPDIEGATTPTSTNSCHDETVALSEPSLNAQTKVAVTHVDVYAIADYYEVSALKALAAENFSLCLNTIEDNDFVHIVRAAYTSTTGRNDSLRQSLVKETVARADTLVGDGRFMAIVSEEPELQHFIADILAALQADAKSSKVAIQIRIESLESALDKVAAEAGRATDQVARLEALNMAKDRAIRMTADLTRDTIECRNCDNDFGGYLDHESNCIRCRRCKCKHMFTV